MNVQELMTEDVVTVDPDDTVTDARKTLIEKGIRQAPVWDGEKLHGIVSRTDLLRAFPINEGDLYDWMNPELSEIMTPDPVTVSPDTDLRDAAQKMYEHRIGCLPVQSGDELVGILTRTDVFYFIADNDESL